MALLPLLALLPLAPGCSPDLRDSKTFEDVVSKASSIEKLTRKRMYGMIMLFVDADQKPFTGWVKATGDGGDLETLGRLEDGQRQGLWMNWHDNGAKASEIEWKNDVMEGSFEEWYPDGKPKTFGQTLNGEVDGEWKTYYPGGLIEQVSFSREGKLVRMQVWKPNGAVCPESWVEEGNGTYSEYESNGSLRRRMIFREGVRVVAGRRSAPPG